MSKYTGKYLAKRSSKQTFLGGAAVLALSTAIVKVIGALYKIPIQHVIGDDGYSYFNSAYDIYNVLLMIAITGLPVAMSRMISEAGAQQNYRQIRRIYDVSKRVFLLIGVVGTVGMAVLCVPLADLVGQRNAWFPILCLAPAVLLICLSSVHRGYFQGQGDMRPTSVSQVLEALCKLIVGLGLAVGIMWFFQRGGLDTETPSEALSKAHAWASGGAIIGVTLGCGLAALYLKTKVHKAQQEPLADIGTARPMGETARELLRIAVPITIGAAGLQLINLADAAIYMWRLKAAAGFTQSEADVLKGIYNFCQTIFNLPCSFISPIVVAVIPALTERITTGDRQGECSVMESALRVMALIACPCAIGLAAIPGPVYALLASHTAETLRIATPILAVLGVCVIFNSTVLVTNGIMQSHNDVMTPVVHLLIGGIIKVIINFILVSNPRINILGAPIGTLVCYVVIAGLNLFAMARKGYAVNVLRTMGKPVLASLLMGAVTFGVRLVLQRLELRNLLVTAGCIAAAAVVYLILVLALRIITREDCALLPKGDKIAKLLRIR